MNRTQWMWMQASVALVRTAAVAMREDAAALPLSAPAHKPPSLPASPWMAGKP